MGKVSGSGGLRQSGLKDESSDGYINASMTWNDFKKRYKIESQERQNAQSILPRNTGNPFANNQQGNEQ